MRTTATTSVGSTGRTAAAFLGVVTAAILALAAVAFACTPSNLVSLSTPVGAPSTAVSVSGSLLSPNDVVVRWNGADGPVLARATAADFERGALNFSVPDVAPGYYTVTAVQKDGVGNDMIARAAFQVVGPAGQVAPAQPAAFSAPAGNDPASTGVTLALAFGAGLVGLGLLGAGGTVVVGHARRRKVASVVSTAEKG